MKTLQGKKTYITVAAAFVYLLAAKFGLVEYNKNITDSLELIALAFLRSGIAGSSAPVPTTTETK